MSDAITCLNRQCRLVLDIGMLYFSRQRINHLCAWMQLDKIHSVSFKTVIVKEYRVPHWGIYIYYSVRLTHKLYIIKPFGFSGWLQKIMFSNNMQLHVLVVWVDGRRHLMSVCITE